MLNATLILLKKRHAWTDRKYLWLVLEVIAST